MQIYDWYKLYGINGRVEDENRVMKKQFLCIAIVCLILLLSVGSIAVRCITNQNQDIIYAYIYSDEKLINTINLTAVETPYTFTVGDNDSGFNIVKVMHNSIGIIDASCPDHVCVNTGFIDSSMLPVVCLPNKLVIQIGTEESSNEIFDAVTQ